VCYFIANPQSAFYESPEFQRVLSYIQTNPTDCKLSEKNDRLRMIYTNIHTIDLAVKRLMEIIG